MKTSSLETFRESVQQTDVCPATWREFHHILVWDATSSHRVPAWTFRVFGANPATTGWFPFHSQTLVYNICFTTTISVASLKWAQIKNLSRLWWFICPSSFPIVWGLKCPKQTPSNQEDVFRSGLCLMQTRRGCGQNKLSTCPGVYGIRRSVMRPCSSTPLFKDEVLLLNASKNEKPKKIQTISSSVTHNK